jgi:protein gp37
VGCSMVSPGCANRYAMRASARIAAFGGPVALKYQGLTRKTNGRPGVERRTAIVGSRARSADALGAAAHDLHQFDVRPGAREHDGGMVCPYLANDVEAQQRRAHVFQVLTKRAENPARL